MLVRRIAVLLLLVSLGLLVAACGQPVGSACMISGSGFTARDPCANQCLSRWSVNCPDDTRITPNVCTGKEHCTPGSCPRGQVCYSFDDPFEERSYCIPESVCGSTFTGDQLHQWERDSAARAAALRAKYEARRAMQSLTPTAEPGDIQNPAAME